MRVIAIVPLMLALSSISFAQTQPVATAAPAAPTTATPPQSATHAETPTAPPDAPATPAAPVVTDPNQYVVPAQTTIPMILMNTINTRSAYVGQSIYCESIYPIAVRNHIIIPKGTWIRGTVTEVVRPGHVKGRAQIGLRFDEMVLPNGTTRQLRGFLAGFGSDRDDSFKPKEGQIQGGGSKGEDAGKIARTTIPGAEIGTIVGATKGAPLEGLGIGSAAGAAAGVVWILATRGKEIVLEHGTSLELQLSQPLDFDREEIGAPSDYDAGPNLPRREYGPRN